MNLDIQLLLYLGLCISVHELLSGWCVCVMLSTPVVYFFNTFHIAVIASSNVQCILYYPVFLDS